MTTIALRGWAQLRMEHLRKEPLCRKCSPRIVPATIVDHIIPHRLRQALASKDAEAIRTARRLYWDKNNLQSLCANCHSSFKQRLEKSGVVAGCDVNGRPLDPNHHWNRQRHDHHRAQT